MHFLGFLIAILGLFFLFWGEPDPWDALHAKAMDKVMECPKPPAQPPQKGLAF